VARRVKPWQIRFSTRGQRSLLQLMADQDVELDRILAKAARESQLALDRAIANATFSAQIRAAQYEAQRQSLLDIATQMWGDDIPAAIMNNLGTSTQMAANSGRGLVKILTPALKPGQAAMLASSMETSAARTFDDVASRYLNSVDLSPSVYKAQAFTMGKIDDVVNSGIALGKSANEIAQDALGFINPNTPGGASYAAHRLGRTELNNAYHTTSVRSYQESPYVDGVHWTLSGSHPSPDSCNNYAEQNDYDLGRGVFPPDSVPDKPHPQCLCFITPITPDPAEFVRRMKAGEYDCGRV